MKRKVLFMCGIYHLDLIGTWEELFVELKSRLDQCLAFNGINKEIEIISLKIESISNQKLALENQEENDAISFKEGLKVIRTYILLDFNS